MYCGFAGTVADALTLMENIEVLINKHPNQTLKNCITLAKKWRTNKMLGGLQATMILIDQDLIVELDGSGNVLEVKDTIGIPEAGRAVRRVRRQGPSAAHDPHRGSRSQWRP